MRRIDKKHNMSKVNLLAEQRYLQSKGLINESFHAPDGTPIGVDHMQRPVNEDPIGGNNELMVIKRQIEDLNPNFTMNFGDLKVMSLDLEITYDLNSKLYKVRNSTNGKYYVNNLVYDKCVDCEFKTPDEVIKFIRLKAEGGAVKFMPESMGSIDEMDYSREIELDDFKFLNNPEFNGWGVEQSGDSEFVIKNDKYPYFEFVVSLDKGKYSHAGKYPWNYEAKHSGGRNYVSSGHQGFYTIERNATSNLENTFRSFLRNRENEMR
jgi:hypothetical protein